LYKSFIFEEDRTKKENRYNEEYNDCSQVGEYVLYNVYFFHYQNFLSAGLPISMLIRKLETGAKIGNSIR
jgi:hypothetical protein